MGGSYYCASRPAILRGDRHLSRQSDADNGNNGFDLSFRGTGIFIPVEFGWLPGQSGGSLPGAYKLGAYYNSSPTPNVLTDINGSSVGFIGAPFVTNNGGWGAYAMADQTIYRPQGSADRGLRIGGLPAARERFRTRSLSVYAPG
jgi:porin